MQLCVKEDMYIIYMCVCVCIQQYCSDLKDTVMTHTD